MVKLPMNFRNIIKKKTPKNSKNSKTFRIFLKITKNLSTILKIPQKNLTN